MYRSHYIAIELYLFVENEINPALGQGQIVLYLKEQV